MQDVPIRGGHIQRLGNGAGLPFAIVAAGCPDVESGVAVRVGGIQGTLWCCRRSVESLAKCSFCEKWQRGRVECKGRIH